MDSEDVIDDVELFLKASRLQELVLGEHREIIRAIERAWTNANYKGPTKRITVAEWIRQNSTDGLSP